MEDRPAPQAPEDPASASNSEAASPGAEPPTPGVGVPSVPEPGRAGSPEASPSAPTPAVGSSGGNGKRGSSLKTVLDGLNKALQKANQEAAQSEEESKALQADVKALTTAYSDLGKSCEAYGKNRPSLEQQRGTQKEYIDKKDDLILGAIDGRKKEVDDVWDKVRKEIEDLEEDLKGNRSAVVEKSHAYEDKHRAAETAQRRFDEVKNRQAIVGDWLKRLGVLKSGIEAAEDASDAVGMYVRFREFTRLLTLIQSNLPDPDVYCDQLDEAWRGLKKSKDELRAAATERSNAEDKLARTEAELDRLRSNRVDEVINRVPPNPPSGSEAAAGSRA